MERYLEKCLTSLIVNAPVLLKQLEVLVVIDGATDRSSEIAHTYNDRFPDVFVTIDKENGNYGSCINRGLQLATGKYVKILDADDSYETSNFEDYLRFLNKVDVDMVITPYMVVNDQGKEQCRVEYDLPKNQMLTWEQLTSAFKKKALQMHAVTYKRQNLIDIHYQQTEGISYTDQEWIFTPLVSVNTAIAYPKPIYKYLVGRQGQTMNPQTIKRNISHNEKCCRRIVKDYKSFDAFDPAKQEYIDYKFMATMRAMYNWYLVQYSDLDLQQLVLFDDFIQSVDPLYIELLDKQVLPYTHFHYIQQWHKKRQEQVKICNLYHWYAKLMNKICRLHAG